MENRELWDHLQQLGQPSPHAPMSNSKLLLYADVLSQWIVWELGNNCIRWT